MPHRRTPTRIGLTVASAAALLLAGCSAQEASDTEAAGSSTVTSTATAPPSDANATQATTTVTAPAPPRDDGGTQAPVPDAASGQAPPADPPSGPREELPYDLGQGDAATVNEEAVTICTNGDGYGINVVAVGANTSCDFAFNTLGELTEGLNATYDNVRQNVPSTVRVYSPVTGGEYDMSCSPVDSVLFSCAGGDGARVYMY